MLDAIQIINVHSGYSILKCMFNSLIPNIFSSYALTLARFAKPSCGNLASPISAPQRAIQGESVSMPFMYDIRYTVYVYPHPYHPSICPPDASPSSTSTSVHVSNFVFNLMNDRRVRARATKTKIFNRVYTYMHNSDAHARPTSTS